MSTYVRKELIPTADGQYGIEARQYDQDGNLLSTFSSIPLSFETQKAVDKAITSAKKERQQAIADHPVNKILNVFGLPYLNFLRNNPTSSS